jgi:OOP family OmpA-OmpF porin
MAPDPESQQLAVKALQEVDGIGDLSDLTTVLREASPYIFKLTKNNEGMVLLGFIPDNVMRDSIMSAAESAGNTNLVDDQMALARGAPPEFQDRVFWAIDLAKKMAGSDIEISDSTITIKGHALNEAAYDELTALLKAPLPLGLKLSSSEIARP